jgi:hypothetical protein
MQEAWLGSEREWGDRERGWLTQLGQDVPKPVDDEHYAKKEEKRADARGVVGRKVRSGQRLVWDFSFLTDLVTFVSVA